MTYVDLSKLPKNHRPSWSPREAIAWGIQEVTYRHEFYGHLCDHFVGLCYGKSYSGFDSAIEHWYAIPWDQKSTSHNPPNGAVKYYGIGYYGHTTLVIRDGKEISNDVKRYGYIDIINWGEIESRWGANYLGWARPWFSSAIPNSGYARPELATVVDLSRIKTAARQHDHSYPFGTRHIQRALVAEKMLSKEHIPGRYGPLTTEAYSKWQRHLGFNGVAANGVPGEASLTRLGNQHGFKVKN